MTLCRWNRLPLLLLALAAGVPLHAQDTPQVPIGKGMRSIAITATDSVTHQAEVATVSIGFQLFAPDKAAAYAAGSRASNAIIDAIKQAGVPSDAIESVSQSINPTSSYQEMNLTPAERTAHAFTIQQSWTVRTRADDAARVLDLAVKAGANSSGNIDWSLADPNTAQAEAAAKALQHARKQAQAMASGLGVTLGELLYASNQVEASPVRPIMRALAINGRSAEALRPLAINARQIETSATVYAVFAIE